MSVYKQDINKLQTTGSKIIKKGLKIKKKKNPIFEKKRIKMYPRVFFFFLKFD